MAQKGRIRHENSVEMCGRAQKHAGMCRRVWGPGSDYGDVQEDVVHAEISPESTSSQGSYLLISSFTSFFLFRADCRKGTWKRMTAPGRLVGRKNRLEVIKFKDNNVRHT
jgi:hypothetical protein